MKKADQVILFKSWAPDLPDLNNPGLTRAQNVVPVDGGYASFYPAATAAATSTSTAGERPRGAMALDLPTYAGTLYVGGSTNAYKSLDSPAGTGLAWDVFATLPSAVTLTSVSTWAFAAYEGVLIACAWPRATLGNTLGQISTLTSLATTGAVPIAQHVAIVGQHVMLGHLSEATETGHVSVQWSAIDQPRNWPTVNSSAAVAAQSGKQVLTQRWGTVNGLVGGDQFGLIFQSGGITRVTYVGGSTVFQFDELEASKGCVYPRSIVNHGGLTYYASADGFYMTDGQQSRSIGTALINRYFADNVDVAYRDRVYGAFDQASQCIYWSIPTSTSTAGRPNRILIFDVDTGRWSLAVDEVECLTQLPDSLAMVTSTLGPLNRILAFEDNNWPAYFTGTPGTAIIETGEVEGAPGGFTFLQGVKPVVDATLNAMTVAVGYRNDQGSTVTYTSEVTANSRSGFCDFRNSARYQRARLTITGTFNAAQGLEIQAVPEGAV